ncbi:hypothetical protein AVEN_180595-1 [Araneus ventricosus]|uniref:Uncharacterized protein n=1 Tax=Araneus ventricosus TaxID=182803 RepID=A0A4Y2ULA7_ARAVE|nr:hypothetical protein AVEN_180595-1 [Araneus ventricosus]
MSQAYAECPLDDRESLAAQNFVDAIRDEDTQHSTRLMDAKDLKSSLAYSMKYEAARTVSKTSRHERLWKEELSSVKPERQLLEVQQKGARAEGVPGDYFEPGKLTNGCLAGRRLPSLNRAPEEGTRVSSLSGKKWTLLGRIYLWYPVFDVGGYRCKRHSFKNRLGTKIEGTAYLHGS